MKRRALIIGSQTGALRGVHNDVAGVRAALEERDFSCDVRIESCATRDGILEGYNRLIADTTADDAVVVYYSGHGCRAVNPTYFAKKAGPEFFQFIVPTDFSREGAFCGILDFELSRYLARLTEKTHNVSVILDCCHSSRMSRLAENARPRALPQLHLADVQELLSAASLDSVAWNAESNPHAVRLTATEFDKLAFEFERGDGTCVGEMTDALLNCLAEAKGQRVSWRALGMRVRDIVMTHRPDQRPEVEGPGRRLLFSAEEIDSTGAVVFYREGQQAFLRAGRLLGSAVGAEFAVTKFGDCHYKPGKEVARAAVTEMNGNRSKVEVLLVGKETDLKDGALAFPLRVPFEKRSVSLINGGTDISLLRQRIGDNKFVVIAERGIASVNCFSNTYQILDPDGFALTEQFPADSDGLERVMRMLTKLAQADALRKLESGGLETAIDISWGYVEKQSEMPLSEGDVMHVGDRLFVKIRNSGSATVFAAVFDIGIASSIVLMSKDPSGIKLRPRTSYRLGEREGRLIGYEARWVEGVPNDGPRRESLVIIIAEDWHDFTALENAHRSDPVAGSALEQLLHQFRSGGKRSSESADGSRAGRYLTKHISFMLDPKQRVNAPTPRIVRPARNAQ